MAKEEQAGDAGNSKKKIIIIAAAAVVVAIIAAVLIMKSGGGGDKEEKKAEAHGEKAAAGGHGEKGKEGAAGAAAGYQFEPFIVNIYDGQELRYLRVKIEFETAKADAKAELDVRQAQLRDAILILLTTKTLQDIQDLHGKNQLRDEILTAVNKIVPPGTVNRVYFTDFVVQ